MARRRDVQATYDRIAVHFAKTRPDPWPEIEDFLEGRRGAVALDIGTGNGRHAELLADHASCVIGLDLSRVALSTAVARAANQRFALQVGLGDAAALPIRSQVVDLAVYIAAIHHLPSRDLRIASLDELARVLAADGAALVSAWSTSHDRFDRDRGFDTLIDWVLPDGETVERYYHIYDTDEFRADLDASDLRVVDAFVSSGNCYAVVAGE